MNKKNWISFKNDNYLYKLAQKTIQCILDESQPDYAVKKALKKLDFKDKNLYVLAIGKAAWTMAKACHEQLGDRIKEGLVITKYKHSLGQIENFNIYEAGHPIADENSFAASKKALEMADRLKEDDHLIFLISGGGSALFESSPLSLEEYQKLNKSLLESGIDIVQMNCIRKHISEVKGGRFALRCLPASISAIILSDVIGDRLDSIASGPVSADISTKEEAKCILDNICYEISDTISDCLKEETPKNIHNADCHIIGSVSLLCQSAQKTLEENGFTCFLINSQMQGEAKEQAKLFLDTAFKKYNELAQGKYAFIIGGETTVTLNIKKDAKYSAKGGRNQEFVWACIPGLSKIKNALLFSLGSDGSDGPCDAAGGIIDCNSLAKLEEKGLSWQEILDCHASYIGLSEIDSLLITGPTGTNVNDICVLMMIKQ